MCYFPNANQFQAAAYLRRETRPHYSNHILDLNQCVCTLVFVYVLERKVECVVILILIRLQTIVLAAFGMCALMSVCSQG